MDMLVDDIELEQIFRPRKTLAQEHSCNPNVFFTLRKRQNPSTTVWSKIILSKINQKIKIHWTKVDSRRIHSLFC